MVKVGSGEYQPAMEIAMPHWPLPKLEVEAMAQKTEEHLGMASKRFGKLIGTEYVKMEAVGESLVRYIYIQKFANHATRWMIVFYRPEQKWLINVVTWDDELHGLF